MIPLIPPLAAVPERNAADGPRILKLWHLASMDAPSVAVAWAWALGWTEHVRPAVGTVAALALVVWAIYVLDRLLDTRAGLRGERADLRERHTFHWRHRRALGALAAVALAAAAWLSWPRLAGGALRPDGAVAAATLFYFGGVHGRARAVRRMLRKAGALVSREFVVGTIFTAGCALPALTRGGDGRALLVPVCALAALAWLNVRARGGGGGAGRRRAATWRWRRLGGAGAAGGGGRSAAGRGMRGAAREFGGLRWS